MRRAALSLVLALAVASAGCAGAEGRQAQELLDEAEEAFAGLETYELGGTMRVETSVGEFTFEVHAAVDQTAEAMLVEMSADALPRMRMVARPEGFWLETEGGWEAVPMPPGAAGGSEQFDVLPYVEDVDVEEGLSIGGEPVVKITGALDAGSFQSSLMAGLPGGVDASFTDTRVVLYLSETSRLPLRMLLDQSVDVEGEQLTVSMDLALAAVNEPVEIPSPA